MTNKGVDIRVIQDWLGHQNIQHTVGYPELSPDRLRGAFPDDDGCGIDLAGDELPGDPLPPPSWFELSAIPSGPLNMPGASVPAMVHSPGR